ncbi:MAG TPA: hypothetical protein DCR90_01145 [Fusobacteriaceae bacterium]|nr:hypothetical protein [Fusobacteriaceae bacterium]
MKEIKPNLFEFATSELSQDAFLCYLLSFSKKIYSERFPLEYKFSRDVIKFLKKKVSLYIEIPLQKWYHMILKVIYL